MDIQNNQTIPKIILEAYDLLLQYSIVDITGQLTLSDITGKSGWIFQCCIRVPYPNKENIPSKVNMKVFIPETFPYDPVDFYPLCHEVKGFPHQDAETGKLCLYEERLAPRDKKRLVHYIKWAEKWLIDAVNGELLQAGDPYELPDFSRKLLKNDIPTYKPIIFSETNTSYQKWLRYLGKFGIVDSFIGKNILGIFTVQFFEYNNNTLISENPFNQSVYRKDKKISGIWILIPDISFQRYRPPQTYEEICKLFLKYNIDFYKILKEAWNLNSYGNISFILIGFPIPKIYGDENFEIHWQPLIFNNLTYYRKNNNLYNIKSRQQDKIWKKLNKEYCFKPDNQLPWGKSINLTHERLYSRGNLSDSLQNKNISLFGCGALGSIIAELLVRGGINNFSLFDYDIIQFGNLCRHTLDGRNLTYNKAEALSEKLVTVNPLVKINAYPNKIPINLEKWNNIKEIMEKLDIIIDCTTSDEAFEWLDNYANTKNKRMISIFFSFHAELLTLIISGSNISCSFIYNDLRNCIKKENPTFAKKYFYQPTKAEQIIEGAGCCFPSFPALNSHIYMLASTTVSIINSYINYKEGLALIIQRNSFNSKISPNSLIETIWMKKY